MARVQCNSWTAEEVEALRQAVADGLTAREATGRLPRRSYHAIVTRAYELDLLFGRKPRRSRANDLSPEDLDRIEALARQGISAKNIGIEIGRPKGTIISAFRKLRESGRFVIPARKRQADLAKDSGVGMAKRALRRKAVVEAVKAPKPREGVAEKPAVEAGFVRAMRATSCARNSGVPLEALTSIACRWPLTGADGVTRFCGRATCGQRGLRELYCDTHAPMISAPKGPGQ